MKKELLYWAAGSAIYFAWFYGVVGGRAEHFGLWALALCLWFWNERTRLFLKNISVWLFYWMLYDSLRVAPNWTVNAVHIQDLYDFDKRWFGIEHNGTLLTLNEWCALHTRPSLDLLAGAFYISWVPLPMLFAAWLYWRDRTLFLRFSWCFFVVNLIGFAIYYLCPAAPPWYVAENGFAFNPNVPRSAAGLNRVDALLGIDLFHRIYTRNSNVFAAMPSLHSAYPLVALLYAIQTRRTWIIALFAATSLGIWVSAIYTNHHYVLDVAAGIGVAALGYWVFERMWARVGNRL
ncbi:MAG: phosphatase PAP2 family protein [Saprospiraceae bacterium]